MIKLFSVGSCALVQKKVKEKTDALSFFAEAIVLCDFLISYVNLKVDFYLSPQRKDP